MALTVVGVSLKMYFGHREARECFARVAERAARHPAVASGGVELFIIPSYLHIACAIVNGLFLGRFAHNPASLEAVLDEASVLAIERAQGRDT